MTTTTTSGAADLLAMVSKALREAYNLGQRYWQQADSEYISQHKKADDTRAKFLALVEETCAALAAGQATAAQQGVAYAALPEPYCNAHDDADACYPDMFSEHQMRAFADATHTLRASHGQAPATQQAGATEPTEQQILEAAFAPAQPAAEASRFGSPELQARIIARCVEKDRADSVLEDAARYRWLAEHCRSTSEHWGGRWSIIIDGPAPKSHDSEDDFDAAVDAARKQGASP